MRMDERGGKGMKAKDRRTRQREEEEGGDEGEGSKRGQRKSNKQLHIGLITPPPSSERIPERARPSVPARQGHIPSGPCQGQMTLAAAPKTVGGGL